MYVLLNQVLLYSTYTYTVTYACTMYLLHTYVCTCVLTYLCIRWDQVLREQGCDQILVEHLHVFSLQTTPTSQTMQTTQHCQQHKFCVYAQMKLCMYLALKQNTNVYTCTYMISHIHRFIHLCEKCSYVCMYIRTHLTNNPIHMYMCMYVHTYVCTCMPGELFYKVAILSMWS